MKHGEGATSLVKGLLSYYKLILFFFDFIDLIFIINVHVKLFIFDELFEKLIFLIMIR